MGVGMGRRLNVAETRVGGLEEPGDAGSGAALTPQQIACRVGEALASDDLVLFG